MDKVKELLIEEFNRVVEMKNALDPTRLERWESLMHYQNGIQFAILLINESEGKDESSDC